MRTLIRLTALAAIAAASVSCGDVVRDSRSPALLRVAALLSANNTGVLLSDVRSDAGGVFDDIVTASLSSTMKDTTVSPTVNNQIFINRYHVEFTRADGRNTPGVDVPFAFDGAVTVAIAPNGLAQVSFEMVRHVAKEEAPLIQLGTNLNEITAIATVTFFGTDTVGNAVSASGKMTVNFANFAG